MRRPCGMGSEEVEVQVVIKGQVLMLRAKAEEIDRQVISQVLKVLTESREA